MARTKQLGGRHIEYLRAHIGSFINTHPHPTLEKGATFLDESFEIWILRVNEALSDAATNPDLFKYLFNTGNWHHQISQNGVPVGYALSGPAASFGGDWSLRGLFASDLAKKIARAIAKIDQERPQDDIEAYYVVVPSHKIVCFFLRGYSFDEVFVVRSTHVPPGPTEGGFYTPREFIQSLSHSTHVRGLVLQYAEPKTLKTKLKSKRSR
jgi:hypothetical protein